MRRIPELGKYHCEVEAAFAIVGGKWKAPIVWHIGTDTIRFNELRDILKTVSPRMLAKQLRELENNGLVIRTMYAEIPPRVEYQLTDAGKAFIPIMKTITKWMLEYCPEVAEQIG